MLGYYHSLIKLLNDFLSIGTHQNLLHMRHPLF